MEFEGVIDLQSANSMKSIHDPCCDMHVNMNPAIFSLVVDKNVLISALLKDAHVLRTIWHVYFI